MRRRDFPVVHASIPNLAPMIDVVMVILIFFMLGTSFAMSEGALRTQLPTQVGPGGGAKIQFVPLVRIDLREQPSGGGCRIVVMGRDLAGQGFASLTAFLRGKVAEGADPGGRIMISSEPGVIYQHVVSAMDACAGAGFSNIQFAVDVERDSPPPRDRMTGP